MLPGIITASPPRGADGGGPSGARRQSAAVASVIRYSRVAVRMNRLRWAMAGVAIVNSSSGLVARISNSGPALMTKVSPSSLSAKILPSYAHGDAVNAAPTEIRRRP